MSETILEKIRRTTPKKSGPLARARASRRVNAICAENLSEALRPHIKKAIKAWVDALGANKVAWNPTTKQWEDSGLADHEIRGRNALHIIEFAVGRAIERSMQVTGSYRDLDTLIASLKQSPEAQRLIKGGFFDMLLSDDNRPSASGDSAQSTAEGAESLPPNDSEAI